MSAIAFTDHVDSVDCSSSHIVAGLSSLEGNIWDGGIQLLSFVTGEVEQSLKCSTGVARIRFIGDEKNVIVAGRDDGSLSLHKTEDIADAQIIPRAHDDCVSSICPDTSAPSLFTTGGWDGAIKLWDIYSNDLLKPVVTLDGAHHKAINDIAMSHSNTNLFASGGQDGFLRLWDQRMGLNNGCAQIYNVMQAVSCVEWDHFEANQLYVGTDAGQIGCYDIRQSGQSWTALQSVHRGRVRRIRSARSVLGVIFSASDDCSVAVSDTSALEFWHDGAAQTVSKSAGITSLARFVLLIYFTLFRCFVLLFAFCVLACLMCSIIPFLHSVE